MLRRNCFIFLKYHEHPNGSHFPFTSQLPQVAILAPRGWVTSCSQSHLPPAPRPHQPPSTIGGRYLLYTRVIAGLCF